METTIEKAVIPPDVKAVGGMPPPGVDNKNVNFAIDAETRYENAVDQRNLGELKSIATQYKGTPVAEAANHSHSIISDNAQYENKVIDPIVKAGGWNTAEGRNLIIDSFEKEREEPRYLDFLKAHFSGSKEAKYMLYGGRIKPTPTFDIQGNQLLKFADESGKPYGGVDLITGAKLTNAQMSERGAGVDRINDTIKYANQTKNAEKFREFFANQQVADAAYANAAPEIKDASLQKEKLLKSLYGSGLNNDQRNFISSVSSMQAGFTQSVSKAMSDLDQFVNNKGLKIDESVRKGANIGLNQLSQANPDLGGLYVGANGSITDGKGRTIGNNELKNLQNNFNKNFNFEQNYTKAKQDIEKNEVYRNLKPEQKQALDMVMDLDRSIEQKHSELSKFGQPSFLLPIQSMGVTDQFSRAVNQAIKGQFNSDAMLAFQDFKNNALKNYPPGTTPTPGELESAFMRTPIYNSLKISAAKRADDAITEEYKLGFAQRTPEQKAREPLGGVNPQENISNVKPEAKAPPVKEGRKEIDLEALAEKFRKKKVK